MVHMPPPNIRISLFIPSLRGGGAERVTVLLANGLVDKGYKVDLITCQGGGAYVTDVDSRINLITLGASRVTTALFPLFKYLIRVKPYALISAMGHANVVAILAKVISKSSAKVLVVEHNTFSRAATSFKSRLLKHFIKILYPFADYIAGVSKGVVEDFTKSIKISKNKIHVLYNPVVSTRLEELMSREPHHPWFLDDGDPVFVGIGRLTEQKDFESLINAFAIVNKSRKSRLVIFGEGELRTQLESQVSRLSLDERISLPGFVSNPFCHLRSSATFVLSSRWEGLPTVLIEALACGVSVVSTDCPSGPEEILEGGKWGYLVPVGDVQALASAMIQSLDNPRTEGVAIRAAEYSSEKAVARYPQLLGVRDGTQWP